MKEECISRKVLEANLAEKRMRDHAKVGKMKCGKKEDKMRKKEDILWRTEVVFITPNATSMLGMGGGRGDIYV